MIKHAKCTDIHIPVYHKSFVSFIEYHDRTQTYSHAGLTYNGKEEFVKHICP